MVLSTPSTGLMCILSRKIQGMLSSQPAFIYRGEFQVKDVKNNYVAKVNFVKTKSPSKLGGLFGKKDDKEPRNIVNINIVKVAGGNEVPLGVGIGNYLRCVHFENKLYWSHLDAVEEFVNETNATALPSSSVFRKEIVLIDDKKYAEADKIVEGIEDRELAAEKSRKKFAKMLYKK